VHRPPSTASLLLRQYFYSGWAFLIPYLAAYLLYLWLKWPANSFSPSALGNGGYIPALLHVYWVLHLIHLILAVIALRTWWHQPIEQAADDSLFTDSPSSVHRRQSSVLRPPPSALRSPSSDHRPPSNLDHLWPVLPWLLLGLIFAIPGVYLEWPSDPWEHLRRINEWRLDNLVLDHSVWIKSGYFIPYSFLSWAVGLRQIFWLDFYYTGICLILCWQYYRLARSCDLGERASIIFVILQALLFGNNIFSFYRYYGISSSIYAQLGAVALTRIVLEAAKSPQFTLRAFFRLSSAVLHPSPNAYSLLLSGFALLALIAFNHFQGAGIAGLSIASIAVWKTLQGKPSRIWWVAGGALTLSITTYLWWPHHTTVDTVYRPGGWLNAWYGFNFAWPSPAAHRAMQILGIYGAINLLAGIVLLRRNHIIGWLTVGPVIALALPLVSLPFANSLAGNSVDAIITFHRMLFALPSGLALASLIEKSGNDARITFRIPISRNPSSVSLLVSTIGGRAKQCESQLAFSLVCTTLISLTILPSSFPSYNRTWHTYAVTPNDLKSRDLFSQYEAIKLPLRNQPESKIIATQAGTALLASYAPNLIGPSPTRRIGLPATDSAATALDFLSYFKESNIQPPRGNTKTIQPIKPTGRMNLIGDPMARDPNDWIALSGHDPEFVTGITDHPTASTALQNHPGTSSHAFTHTFIPIQAQKTYRLEIAAKQTLDEGATVYLAVAWYDSKERLLVSNSTSPQGAGNPRGWNNGTYSYFGLVSQTPPNKWTNYGISFGLGETASIPPHARLLRVGALLNYNASPSAVVQLTDLRLFEKSTSAMGFAIPQATSIFSPGSQAALLSSHWPFQQTMTDRAGTNEILEAMTESSVPVPPE